MRALPMMLSGLLLFTQCGQAPKESADDPHAFVNPELFKDHIRTTDFQTPEQEMAGFTKEAGFLKNFQVIV
jgi:hypothetical protein